MEKKEQSEKPEIAVVCENLKNFIVIEPRKPLEKDQKIRFQDLTIKPCDPLEKGITLSDMKRPFICPPHTTGPVKLEAEHLEALKSSFAPMMVFGPRGGPLHTDCNPGDCNPICCYPCAPWPDY